MRAPLAPRREPTGNQNKAAKGAKCFWTQYIMIQVPHTHAVPFWHISNIPPRISQIQICYNAPCFIYQADL